MGLGAGAAEGVAARRKNGPSPAETIAASPAGRAARNAAIAAFMPLIAEVVRDIGADKVRIALPVLRELRIRLEGDGA